MKKQLVYIFSKLNQVDAPVFTHQISKFAPTKRNQQILHS